MIRAEMHMVKKGKGQEENNMRKLKNKNEEVILFEDSHKAQDQKDANLGREPLVMVKKSSQSQSTLPASEASKVLLHAKGKWPFDFIPDELIIEEKRIIIKRHFFPFITTISSIPMNKISNFEVTHSIFCSSVSIKASLIPDVVFQWMDHADAQQAKELIDGIRIRDNESIVVLEQEKRRYIQTLELIGQT